MASALEVAGFRARLVYIGIDVGGSAPARLGLIQSKELKITGSIGSPGVWPDTLRFLANSRIDMTPLVTQHFDVEHALDAMAAAHHPETTVKAHIELTATLPG
jgi:L-iditol 2-dehydrogenase